jgi:hypothetical protein
MTRKDYIAIAHELRRVREIIDTEGVNPNAHGGFCLAVDAIMRALAADNPRFCAEKFYEAIFKD